MLRFPRALWTALLVATILSSPGLFGKLAMDDQFMALRLEGVFPNPAPGPANLYTFATGGGRTLTVDGGVTPWWLPEGAKAAFFRPLSSAIFWLEHAAVGRHALLYHVDSLAAYVVVVALVSLLFRRVLKEREAALATLLFSVAPIHYMVAVWPAARHVSISAVFAFASLLLHLRARETERLRAASEVASVALAALALLGGESALAVFAFVFAYEAVGRVGSVGQRVLVLLPWGALLVVYLGLYKHLGYGISHSSAYLDPTRVPLEYLTHLPTRLLILAASAFLGFPSELSNLLPQAAVPFIAAAGALGAVAVGLMFLRVLGGLEEAERRSFRWLILGGALAVLPGAAGILGDRVMFMSSVATAAVIAVVLLRTLSSKESRMTAPLWLRVGATVLAFVHVLCAPFAFVGNAAAITYLTDIGLEVAKTAELPKTPGARVVGIGLSDMYNGFYLASEIWFAPHAAPLPETVQLLSMAPHDHLVKRLDDRTIEVTVLDGTLFETPIEQLSRAPNTPMSPGDLVPLGPWTIRIAETVEGRPSRFSVTFDTSVDDGSIALVIWKDGAIRALVPPAIGQEVRVRHEVGPTRF